MEENIIIEKLNKSWGWMGFSVVEVLRVNDFGNVIFRVENGGYFRLVPEELSCEKIANSELEYIQILGNPEFDEDWKMERLVETARVELGRLESGWKYSLKVPAVLGGAYDVGNIAKISFVELISASGDLAFQIKDLEDGDEVELVITE